MDRLEELKNKYQAALRTIQQRGVVLSHLHVQDNKLFIQGSAPSEEVKNEVWNQIKAADPAKPYKARYGATSGPWTTNDFVEAVYRSLAR